MSPNRAAAVRRIAFASLLSLAIAAPMGPAAQTMPSSRANATAAPTSEPTAPPRRRNSIVMDVDFTESAAHADDDAIDIAGTLELVLDRIAARTAPPNAFGQSRPIEWESVDGDMECRHPDDAGILEIRVARFAVHDYHFVAIGRESGEADLSFRLFSCDGRQLLSYPTDGSQYGLARFSPYYISLTGTAGAIALANAHANNESLAAVLAVVNGYPSLQANVGAHDPSALRELALQRLVGNIPGDAVPPPAPGTVAARLESCAFAEDASGVLRLRCSG